MTSVVEIACSEVTREDILLMNARLHEILQGIERVRHRPEPEGAILFQINYYYPLTFYAVLILNEYIRGFLPNWNKLSKISLRRKRQIQRIAENIVRSQKILLFWIQKYDQAIENYILAQHPRA